MDAMEQARCVSSAALSLLVGGSHAEVVSAIESDSIGLRSADRIYDPQAVGSTMSSIATAVFRNLKEIK